MFMSSNKNNACNLAKYSQLFLFVIPACESANFLFDVNIKLPLKFFFIILFIFLSENLCKTEGKYV